ncbi:hypothetical protein V5T82_16970 [Magnetovibrio sp. PR-2]|uniref:hypothetical protein n=1 Tax=Magnetovibrio sp. PR-2 TaxID=3120356 RepID=UPI002FCDE77B
MDTLKNAEISSKLIRSSTTPDDYVTWNQAMKSLALVLYSPDPNTARQHVIDEG